MPGNCLLTPFLVQSQGRVLLNFSSSLCFRRRLRLETLSPSWVHFMNSGKVFTAGVSARLSAVGTGCLAALCDGTILPCTALPASSSSPPAQQPHPD